MLRLPVDWCSSSHWEEIKSNRAERPNEMGGDTRREGYGRAREPVKIKSHPAAGHEVADGQAEKRAGDIPRDNQ